MNNTIDCVLMALKPQCAEEILSEEKKHNVRKRMCREIPTIRRRAC